VGVAVEESGRVGDWPGDGVAGVAERATVRVMAGRWVGEAVVVGVRVRAAVAVTRRWPTTYGVGVSRGTAVSLGSVGVALGGAGVSVGEVVAVGESGNDAASTTVDSGVNVASGSSALLALARGPTSMLANPAA
jgi:hypothetical protein